MRLTNINEILKIGEKDSEVFIGDIKLWGYKQNDTSDNEIKHILSINNIFDYSQSGSLAEKINNIRNLKIDDKLKSYMLARILICRGSWLDESYIGLKPNIKLNPKNISDWDFECFGIKFDLKNSVLPKWGKKYGFENSESIIKDPEGFIRKMYLNSSNWARANDWHKISNRFFIVYYSKKDKDYFNEKNDLSKQNTEYLEKINFVQKKKAIDFIFENITTDNIFKFDNVEYYYRKELKKYDTVYCVLCLVGEQEDGKIKAYVVKNVK